MNVGKFQEELGAFSKMYIFKNPRNHYSFLWKNALISLKKCTNSADVTKIVGFFLVAVFFFSVSPTLSFTVASRGVLGVCEA